MSKKGLNFALPSTSLAYSKHLADYELFIRDKLSLKTSHVELLKSRLKGLAFSSFKTYTLSRKSNLATEEFESLLKLSKNKNAIIQKSDKGNSVVLIDKIIYTSDIKKLLDNSGQFEKCRIDLNKELNFILNCKKKSLTFLRKLKMQVRLMRICTTNYAKLIINLEFFMALQKSIKRLLMAALLFN